MNWTILNVSIPVYDLQKSKQFYDMLIGYNENQKLLYQSLYKNEESIFFGKIYLPITALFEGASLVFGFSITSEILKFDLSKFFNIE